MINKIKNKHLIRSITITFQKKKLIVKHKYLKPVEVNNKH